MCDNIRGTNQTGTGGKKFVSGRLGRVSLNYQTVYFQIIVLDIRIHIGQQMIMIRQ